MKRYYWTNKKALTSILKNLDDSDGLKMEYGIFSDAGMHPKADMPLANLMAIHELRTDGWQRPVFQISFDQNHEHFTNMFSKGVETLVVLGAKNKQHRLSHTLSGIGSLAVSKATAIFGNRTLLKPNTTRTRMIKGHDAPLVDLGLLKKSVKFEVSKRRKE